MTVTPDSNRPQESRDGSNAASGWDAIVAQYEEACKVLARIDDNTYFDDQQTLRAIDKTIEPFARSLVSLYEEEYADV